MRLIYAGTPEFAVAPLEALLAAGHDVVLVLTQPDRPAGRGQQPAFSAVKQAALRYGLPLYQPATLKQSADYAPLREAEADAMVVTAYGLILPQAVLDLTRFGAFNVHASLLPRWRGAAPIQRAILAGDGESGVCIMRMEAGLDTGPVLLREAVSIDAQETAGSLHDKLRDLGARLIVPALQGYAEGRLQAVAQSEEGLSYAAKIDKAEARIDWREPALAIERRIRAFNPVPGASARIGELELKLWRALPGGQDGPPGTLLAVEDKGLHVACGSGSLWLTELQRPGAKRLAAKVFLRGVKLEPGQRFSLPGD